MKRLLTDKLLAWKNNPEKKPLIVYGARQIGKTHTIMEFGLNNYASIAYFYFEHNYELCRIFEEGISSIASLITKLEGHINQQIIPGATLVFFDEIQSCPAAISCLKRFCETAPEYHVIAAGSLLGVALRRVANNTKAQWDEKQRTYSFPVGKVDELIMYPLTFEEFLMEFNPHLIPLIRECYNTNSTFSVGLHNQALELFLQYLVIGGMPEAILEYKKTKDYIFVRAKQLAICNNYILDMSKYTESRSESIKNEAVYNSLSSQLARQNRKFQYALVKSGARANEYENSLAWLEKAAILIKCNRVSEGKEPLAFYEDFLAFKVYMSDVGLLAAKSNNSHLSILGRTVGDIAMGAMTENYIAQSLKANGLKFYYWESGNNAELDFVIQIENEIIPIEAKSWKSVRSQSLEVFRKKYNIKKSIRISAKNFGFENGIKSVPLYAVWCIV
ncbi:MAG: ATP-binding protein [Christensenellaceae bacterium]|jgi:predicted AAA+ superfamily ATPase|nr:ATP-binding protein [Christensenellaceae bacterium]